ncbi:MAG: DUF309 domain-containing protein [Dehalococcoidia bacterium]|nr:DUF309 domain-containing protein [Dehalococcoidia bacterium]MYA52646.1 DUF309 domain-containing protein [Dehalococcoidia bacterium]
MPSAKTERPRDELGRPLPAGSPNLLAVDDLAGLSTAEANALALAHFDAGRYFLAHEAWEAAWLESKGTASEALFKGLAQLGAGYTHAARGNAHGMRVLLERALDAIRVAPGPAWGIDLHTLGSLVERDLDRVRNLAAGASLLPVDPWRLPRS